MNNRDILNRELINDLLIRLFNQILDIETQYVKANGVEDLSISELHLLDTISQFSHPTMSEVAQKATLTNGTITTAVKRLEEKKYVVRTKDENDRRIIRVGLTPKAIKVCRVHQEFHDDMVSQVCNETKILEDEVLLKSLQQLLYIFEEVKER
jgi:DNA-binding MarR family transcriptional regulator